MSAWGDPYGQFAARPPVSSLVTAPLNPAFPYALRYQPARVIRVPVPVVCEDRPRRKCRRKKCKEADYCDCECDDEPAFRRLCYCRARFTPAKAILASIMLMLLLGTAIGLGVFLSSGALGSSTDISTISVPLSTRVTPSPTPVDNTASPTATTELDLNSPSFAPAISTLSQLTNPPDSTEPTGTTVEPTRITPTDLTSTPLLDVSTTTEVIPNSSGPSTTTEPPPTASGGPVITTEEPGTSTEQPTTSEQPPLTSSTAGVIAESTTVEPSSAGVPTTDAPTTIESSSAGVSTTDAPTTIESSSAGVSTTDAPATTTEPASTTTAAIATPAAESTTAVATPAVTTTSPLESTTTVAEFGNFTSVRIDGGDPFRALTYEECFLLCENNGEDCPSFDYNFFTLQCFLHTEAIVCNNFVADFAVFHHTTRMCPGRPYPPPP